MATKKKPVTPALQSEEDISDLAVPEEDLSGLAAAEEPAGAAALSQVEGISETPAFQRGVSLRSLIGPTGGETELPVSPESLVEMLPGVGGAIGALAGGPVGAAGGGMTGEAARQAIRRLVGAPVATGVGQEALGLDPESRGASSVGLALEGLTGGVGELGGRLAGKIGGALADVKGLRSRAAEEFASMFPSKTARGTEIMTERIKPILEELPGPQMWKTRESINLAARQKAAKAGAEVGAATKTATPTSFEPAVKGLRAAAEKELETAGHFVYTRMPDGTMVKDWVADVASDPTLFKELRKIGSELRKAEFARTTTGKPITMTDVQSRRQTFRESAQRAKKSVLEAGGVRQLETPKSQALLKAADLLADILHTPQGQWTPQMANRAAMADAVHTAWKTVVKGTEGKDPGGAMFVWRWVVGRTVAGPAGTAAAAATTNPSFWRAAGSKVALKASKEPLIQHIGRALRAGDETKAAQLLKAAIAAWSAAPEEEQQ